MKYKSGIVKEAPETSFELKKGTVLKLGQETVELTANVVVRKNEIIPEAGVKDLIVSSGNGLVNFPPKAKTKPKVKAKK